MSDNQEYTPPSAERMSDEEIGAVCARIAELGARGGALLWSSEELLDYWSGQMRRRGFPEPVPLVHRPKFERFLLTIHHDGLKTVVQAGSMEEAQAAAEADRAKRAPNLAWDADWQLRQEPTGGVWSRSLAGAPRVGYLIERIGE